MKIRLSEDEVYEIKMPEEIEIQEFSAIVSKFNFLIKNLTKFGIVERNPVEKQDDILHTRLLPKNIYNLNKQTWITLRDNKNILIEVLRGYYFKTNEGFNELLKKYNLSLRRDEMCTNRMKVLIEMHKINPNEIGLTQFPTKNKSLKNCILREEN